MRNIVIILFIFSLLTTGCTKDDVERKAETQVSIYVRNAGTLSKLIPANSKYTITDLTVSGYLDGDDILFIREMAGGGFTADDKTEGKLARLDLTNAHIVASMKHYFCVKNSDYDYTFYPTGDNFINAEMFSYLSSLTSITLPKNIISAASESFNKCLSLKEINVSKNNTQLTSIDGILFSKDSTELLAFPYAKANTYTIPNYVKKVSETAFSYCAMLTTVSIPGNHINLKNGAFHDCTGLTSVYLGDDISFIGYDVFSNCTSLKDIYSKSKTPIEEYHAFTNVDKANCKIHVPKGSAAAYRNADGWKEFTNIVEE